MRIRRALIGICLAWTFMGTASCRTITVGPQREVTRIVDAARIAVDDDVVEIDSGTYVADVAVWAQKRLTIRGAAPGVVLSAGGAAAQSKAIWVFRNGNFQVQGITFRGARVADGNGAGIRLESGTLRVVDCVFDNNQNGILTGNDPATELAIVDSIFMNAPIQVTPPPHLLYAGAIRSLSIIGSRFQAGYMGHLVKSRARQSDLRYNTIDDGVGGQAAYEIEFPNGGDVLLLGNAIGQSEKTSNRTVISYGAEGERWPVNTLVVSHNTLLSRGWMPAWFVRVWDSHFTAKVNISIFNNLIAGYGIFSLGLNGAVEGNLFAPPSALNEPDSSDFRLSTPGWLSSWRSIDIPGRLRPVAEPLLPAGIRKLPPIESWKPGAYQQDPAQ